MKKISRQIIAIGGFAKGSDTELMDRYVLAQAPRPVPSVCFLATASGDAPTYLEKFYTAFARYRCRPTHVPLFGRTPDLKRALLTQDVIYVGGGNTKSMLAVWREWGLPQVLRKAWSSGVVLAGFSAGAICWFDTGVTDSWEHQLAGLTGLGFLPGTCCPHFDSESERRPALHRLVAARQVPKALALDDGAGAHFVGRKLVRIVSCAPDGGGYEVRPKGPHAVETALPVVRLSSQQARSPGLR